MPAKLLKIFVGLTLLIALGLAIYLVPPHLEIRNIDPTLPSDADLATLAAGDDKPINVSYILTSSQVAPGRNLGHHSIVIEWRDGRKFLIDAGMDHSNAIEFGVLLERMWGADPATVHTTIEEALSQDFTAFTGVGLTHLHIDHTQGLQALCPVAPNMQVFQTDEQRRIQNMNTVEGAAIVEACKRAPSFPGDKLTEVPGFPGLAMYTLGGHTPGSTLFAVRTADHLYLFSGDITNTKANLVSDTPKDWWYSYLVVPEDTSRTARLRRWLGQLDRRDNTTVIVSHDIDSVSEALQPYGNGDQN